MKKLQQQQKQGKKNKYLLPYRIFEHEISSNNIVLIVFIIIAYIIRWRIRTI